MLNNHTTVESLYGNMKKHRLYEIWSSMHKRCKNKNAINYSYYGGKGISVCTNWNNFETFISDMNDSYEKGMSLDRIDSSLGYSICNCRWTTKTVQARNTKLLQKNNTTGYRGVSFQKKTGRYRARIGLTGYVKSLGNYTTAIEAAIAYDTYVIENKLEHTINNVTTSK
jgi:hypothetical protein